MVPGSSKLGQLSLQRQRKEKEARFPWVVKRHANCPSHIRWLGSRDQKVMGI